MTRITAILAGIVLAVLPPQTPAPARQVCFTIDDLPWVSAVPMSQDAIASHTRQLIAALVANKIPAIGFVNEQKLAADGNVDPRRVRLLQHWLDAGMELGNHTFSHLDLHTTPLDEFQRDVVRGEAVTSQLLAASGKRLRYPAGMTWLHRWAITQGKKGIFAGEPAVPEWIERAGR